MKFIELLYYRYYNFQVKMGNADIAPISAMLIIVFITMLYYFGVFFLVITFIPEVFITLNTSFFLTFTIVLFFSLILIFYCLLIQKEKYKEIIKLKNQEYSKKRSYISILFPVIGFILFNLGWILKMLQNQGKF